MPDHTKSLQARAQQAMLQTVSHSFSYSPHKNIKPEAGAPAGGKNTYISMNRKNSQRPNYDIVNHSNLDPKYSVDKAVLYNPLN